MNDNIGSSTDVCGVEAELFDSSLASSAIVENVENGNGYSSTVKRANEDDYILSQQLSDLNKTFAISEAEEAQDETIDRPNEHIVPTKESLCNVTTQHTNATPNLSTNDDDDAESYVKIPVQQLINTFEKQMRSIINQNVNEKVQLDFDGKLAMGQTNESKPNGTVPTANNNNYGDNPNKIADIGPNQEACSNSRINSQQIKQIEQCEPNITGNEYDIGADTSPSTNYNQEISLAANNVSTYSQFTNNYAYGSCSTTTAAALDTLDTLLDQNKLQRGKRIYISIFLLRIFL